MPKTQPSITWKSTSRVVIQRRSRSNILKIGTRGFRLLQFVRDSSVRLKLRRTGDAPRTTPSALERKPLNSQLLCGPDKLSDVSTETSYTPALRLIDYRVALRTDEFPGASVKNVNAEDIDVVIDSVVFDVTPVHSG